MFKFNFLDILKLVDSKLIKAKSEIKKEVDQDLEQKLNNPLTYKRFKQCDQSARSLTIDEHGERIHSNEFAIRRFYV